MTYESLSLHKGKQALVKKEAASTIQRAEYLKENGAGPE